VIKIKIYIIIIKYNAEETIKMDDTREQILSPTIKEEPQLQIFPGDEGCQENIQRWQVSAFK
jgi:hypothetical protein